MGRVAVTLVCVPLVVIDGVVGTSDLRLGQL
jgi:hypothetical protein